MAPGVSQELDELKQQYCALPDFLTQLVRRGGLIWMLASCRWAGWGQAACWEAHRTCPMVAPCPSLLMQH